MINRVLNKLTSLCARLKTLFWYRPQFREIGSTSTLYKPMLLVNPRYMTLGSRVTIREGARIEALKTNPARTPSLVIGDNTNIEQNVHIVCHCLVHIGKNVSITGNCSIVDVTHPYENIDDPRKIGSRILEEDSSVEIGDGCFIGMGTIILPNVIVGQYCIIGANSVVASDLPAYSVCAGAPAKVIRRYDPATDQWGKVKSE